MTNPPTILTNCALDTYEGCSSIADPSGNLLFYTARDTIWNQQHVCMANGYGLLGGVSSTQESIIVKQPGSSTIYFIFTTAENGTAAGLCYSIVDMSLAAGMGSVTAKNISLYTPTCEKLTAVKHCNGEDVWIISHDFNSTNFRSYLLTSSGLNLSPVLSSIGSNINYWSSFTGAMKASPNGKKLGLVFPNVAQLFDFNNTTGVISNSLVLGFVTDAYSCEFSPDGTKFYSGGFLQYWLYQWDLAAGTSSAIAASMLQIPTSTLYFGSMQMASNGKIYLATWDTTLAEIDDPNNAGLSCNFVKTGQSIAPRSCGLGLPNFMTSYFKNAIPFTYTISNCKNSKFTAPLSLYAASGTSITSLNWDFGDPASGLANISSLSSVTHSYSNYGSYTVQLILNHSCGADTVKKVVSIIPCSNIMELETNQNAFHVYPSPSTDEITIAVTNELKNNYTKALLFNNMGQLIRDVEITFKNSIGTINTSYLESGIYTIQLYLDNTVCRRKFIKH